MNTEDIICLSDPFGWIHTLWLNLQQTSSFWTAQSNYKFYTCLWNPDFLSIHTEENLSPFPEATRVYVSGLSYNLDANPDLANLFFVSWAWVGKVGEKRTKDFFFLDLALDYLFMLWSRQQWQVQRLKQYLEKVDLMSLSDAFGDERHDIRTNLRVVYIIVLYIWLHVTLWGHIL